MSGASIAEQCCALLKENEDSDKLADLLEATFPNCSCEGHSVGEGSPGPVADVEGVIRLVVSPRDIDEDGRPSLPQFNKAFKNGFSVCRSVASDDEMRELAIDNLLCRSDQNIRVVHQLMIGEVVEIRSAMEGGQRIFAVYDQTVERRADKQAVRIPTHASVFQRMPLKDTTSKPPPARHPIQKKLALQLRDVFFKALPSISDYRDGLFDKLNEEAKAGKYQSLPSQAKVSQEVPQSTDEKEQNKKES